jgi:hypothetical protein
VKWGGIMAEDRHSRHLEKRIKEMRERMIKSKLQRKKKKE